MVPRGPRGGDRYFSRERKRERRIGRKREKKGDERGGEREKCAENSLGGDKGFTFYVTPHWMSDGTTSLPTGIFHLPGYWYTDDISLRAARGEHVRYIGVTNRILAGTTALEPPIRENVAIN